MSAKEVSLVSEIFNCARDKAEEISSLFREKSTDLHVALRRNRNMQTGKYLLRAIKYHRVIAQTLPISTEEKSMKQFVALWDMFSPIAYRGPSRSTEDLDSFFDAALGNEEDDEFFGAIDEIDGFFDAMEDDDDDFSFEDL